MITQVIQNKCGGEYIFPQIQQIEYSQIFADLLEFRENMRVKICGKYIDLLYRQHLLCLTLRFRGFVVNHSTNDFDTFEGLKNSKDKTMIDYTDCNLEKVSVHQVGNKTREESLFLSKNELAISNETLLGLVKQFFLSPFNQPEFYSFTFSNQDFSLNPLFQFATQVFESKNLFHPTSVNIAKHLYELSVHPQIKSGDLFVGYFTNIDVEGKLVNALGIFKSENRQPFLKLDSTSTNFTLQYENGINTEKLDKGCLIFNDEKESGYKICIIDKSNKAAEAQYWKDLFLMVKPCDDGYHHTQQFLEMTKNYVTDQFADEFEVSKTDQIDVLNRSIDYFKKKDNFDRKNFETEVLQEPEIIESFRKFNDGYQTGNDISGVDNFGISSFAVKKQARVFKSVLKLDKNFHIYIHGDKQLIERGVDDDGRKYYKIYYQQES